MDSSWNDIENMGAGATALVEISSNGNGHSLAELGQESQIVGTGRQAALDLLDSIKPKKPRPPVLPDDFYDSSEVLDHISNAARARGVRRDALLAGVLARVCLYTDYRVKLPAIIGTTASLNSIFALYGSSGRGKDTGLDLSAEFMPYSTLDSTFNVLSDEIPLGSGEGLAASYFDYMPGDDGKPRLQQAYHSVLVRVSESQDLETLAKRGGNTTSTTVRKAFNGQTLGSTTKDKHQRIILPAQSYRMMIVLCIQPKHTEYLLSDDAGGTPQRLVWFQAMFDLSQPKQRPDWPGVLKWEPPVSGSTVIDVDQSIRDELIEADWLKATGQVEETKYDGQRGLVMLKLSGMLAFLHGRTNISVDDWARVQTVMTTSDGIRDHALSVIGEAKHERNSVQDGRSAVRERRKQRTINDIVRVARNVTNRVYKEKCLAASYTGPAGSAYPHYPVTSRTIQQAVHSRDRDILDDAISHAGAKGWLLQDGDKYVIGTNTGEVTGVY